MRSRLSLGAVVLVVGGACGLVACGGDDGTTVVGGGEDSGSDSTTGADSGRPDGSTGSDGGADSTTATDSGGDATSDAAGDATSDAKSDALADAASDAPADAASDAPVDAASDAPLGPCTPGTLCSDSTVCVAADGGATGTCVACASDTQCNTASAGTLCYPSQGGKCLVGQCHPKSDPTKCPAAGAICCATASSAGSCFATAGNTNCCDDSDCSGSTVTTRCDTATHTCACPLPTPGTWYVAPTGSDADTATSGNGSSACPFKTIAKALAKSVAAASATTIVLKAGTVASPNVYGTGCSGGAPCDAVPIAIPNTITNGLTLSGAGVTGGVRLTGGAGAASAVVSVAAPATSISNLTIVPTGNAVNGGTVGIRWGAAAAASEGSVTSVNIVGVLANGSVAGTGAGIQFTDGNASSPILGPGLTISGGSHSVFVQGNGTPRITGSVASPTALSGSGLACVRVSSGVVAVTPGIKMDSGAATSNQVTLTNCGGVGGVVVDTAAAGGGSSIDRVLIQRGLGGSTLIGITAATAGAVTVTNTTVKDCGNTGILARNSGVVTVSDSIVDNAGGAPVSAALRGGIVITDSAKATLTNVTSSNNTGDGVRCDSTSTLKLRTSTTLSNVGSGVYVDGACVADLGVSPGDTGKNVFNKTSSRNTLSGLCLHSTAVLYNANESTWSCGRVAAGCAAGSPTAQAGSAVCRADVDYTAGAGVSLTTGGALCCN